MPSYKTAFGSYLKSEDLQGRAVKAVVGSVDLEEVKDNDTGKMEKKLIMHFVGKDKALILNRTNCEAMEIIAGSDDYGRWVGHQVVLFVDPTVKFGGKVTGGLRIRGAAQTAVPPPPPPPPVEDLQGDEDSIPF